MAAAVVLLPQGQDLAARVEMERLPLFLVQA
jgi:hypothetical protein